MHELLALAEAPNGHDPLKPGEEFVTLDDCQVFFGLGDDATVERLREPADGLEATVERVRALLRRRARSTATWGLLMPPHDSSIIDRLTAVGLVPATPARATVMARTEPPRPGGLGVVVTSVDTPEDFKAHVTVTHEVFDRMDRLPAELARIERDGARDVADRRFLRYVAWIDGEPVGAATATFAPGAVMLHSGCTLPRHRGHGVYTAMVRKRWEDAVAKGTPALVTRAGAMSQPILAKLGFEAIGEMRFLLDDLKG